jgi:hypothetical protein
MAFRFSSILFAYFRHLSTCTGYLRVNINRTSRTMVDPRCRTYLFFVDSDFGATG